MNHNAANLVSPTNCVERENVYCSVHVLSSGTLREGWKGAESGVCAWPDVVTPASICDSLPWQRRRSSSYLFLFPAKLDRRFTYLFRHTDIPIFLFYRLSSPFHATVVFLSIAGCSLSSYHGNKPVEVSAT